MRARGDEEVRLLAPGREHRCHYRHVGQMRAAVIGAVEEPGVAGEEPAFARADHGADARTHGTQVHGHVRRVGHQRPLAVEQRARVVEPLADVHRLRGRLEYLAHLRSDVHEQVVEDLDAGRIGGRRRHTACGTFVLEQQLAACERSCPPACLQHHGAVGLDDQRRSVQLPAHCAHRHQRNLAPAAEPGAYLLWHGGERGGWRDRERARLDRGGARLDTQRLDDDLERPGLETEAPEVLGMKTCPHLPERRHRYRQRDVAVAGAQLEELCDPRVPGLTAVGCELGASLLRKKRERAAGRGESRLTQRTAQAGAAL